MFYHLCSYSFNTALSASFFIRIFVVFPQLTYVAIAGRIHTISVDTRTVALPQSGYALHRCAPVPHGWMGRSVCGNGAVIVYVSRVCVIMLMLVCTQVFVLGFSRFAQYRGYFLCFGFALCEGMVIP